MGPIVGFVGIIYDSALVAEREVFIGLLYRWSSCILTSFVQVDKLLWKRTMGAWIERGLINNGDRKAKFNMIAVKFRVSAYKFLDQKLYFVRS